MIAKNGKEVMSVYKNGKLLNSVWAGGKQVWPDRYVETSLFDWARYWINDDGWQLGTEEYLTGSAKGVNVNVPTTGWSVIGVRSNYETAVSLNESNNKIEFKITSQMGVGSGQNFVRAAFVSPEFVAPRGIETNASYPTSTHRSYLTHVDSHRLYIIRSDDFDTEKALIDRMLSDNLHIHFGYRQTTLFENKSEYVKVRAVLWLSVSAYYRSVETWGYSVEYTEPIMGLLAWYVLIQKEIWKSPGVYSIASGSKYDSKKVQRINGGKKTKLFDSNKLYLLNSNNSGKYNPVGQYVPCEIIDKGWYTQWKTVLDHMDKYDDQEGRWKYFANRMGKILYPAILCKAKGEIYLLVFYSYYVRVCKIRADVPGYATIGLTEFQHYAEGEMYRIWWENIFDPVTGIIELSLSSFDYHMVPRTAVSSCYDLLYSIPSSSINEDTYIYKDGRYFESSDNNIHAPEGWNGGYSILR